MQQNTSQAQPIFVRTEVSSPDLNVLPQGRVRLGYLDGVRGLAALFVVWHHCWQFVVMQAAPGSLPRWFSAFTVLKLGMFAVSIFIVLSGYCLMLPVARTAELTLSGGGKGFVHRRFSRIIPPYLACLLLSAALPLFVPALNQPTRTQWDIALPALTKGSLASHVLLVHNLFPDWRWKINPPLWSVALEWQIYFVFAFVLLPIARRGGVGRAVIAAFILGIVPSFMQGAYINAWMIGLFGFGMAAATANFAPGAEAVRQRLMKLPLLPIALALSVMVALAVLKVKLVETSAMGEIAANSLVGIAAALFLFATTNDLQKGQRVSALARLADLPLIRRVGEFSYSLYLIHYPLLAAFFLYLLGFHLSPASNFLAISVIFAPLLLLVAYGFHLLFERPFMKTAPAPVRTPS